jgi:predicted DNA-binding transcriptional regulator AlpA
MPISSEVIMTANSTFADEIAGAVAARISNMIRSGNAPVAPEFLTAGQVAQLTGFSQKALESYRSQRIGPPFLEVGKNVRYRISDVRAWIESGGAVE